MPERRPDWSRRADLVRARPGGRGLRRRWREGALARAHRGRAAATSGKLSRGDIAPELEKVAFALPAGGISEPVPRGGGYRILQAWWRRRRAARAVRRRSRTRSSDGWRRQRIDERVRGLPGGAAQDGARRPARCARCRCRSTCPRPPGLEAPSLGQAPPASRRRRPPPPGAPPTSARRRTSRSSATTPAGAARARRRRRPAPGAAARPTPTPTPDAHAESAALASRRTRPMRAPRGRVFFVASTGGARASPAVAWRPTARSRALLGVPRGARAVGWALARAAARRRRAACPGTAWWAPAAASRRAPARARACSAAACGPRACASRGGQVDLARHGLAP